MRMAMRALSLNISVGQKSLAGTAVKLPDRLFLDKPLLIQVQKEILRYFVVQWERGSGVIVESYPDALEGCLHHCVIPIDDYLWGNIFLVGADCDGHTMFI